MQLGTVVGQAVATIKHPSLQGWRLVVVQLTTSDGKPDGEPILALDMQGAALDSRVIVCSEGGAIRKLMGSKNSPARWLILGICDT